MKNIYYLIWVDIITSARRNFPDRAYWKYSIFVLITMCNALNIYSLYLILKYCNIVSFLIKIDIFPGRLLNSAAAFFIQFASPFILVNYFFIFYNDRYKKLIEIYPNKKGKLALIYSLCSIWTGFIAMVLYGLLTK